MLKPGDSEVKNLPVVQKTGVPSLGWEDHLEEGLATHSSTLAGKNLWTEEPGWLWSMGSRRVGHDWNNEHMHTKQWQSRGTYTKEMCRDERASYPREIETVTGVLLVFWFLIPELTRACFTYYYSLPPKSMTIWVGFCFFFLIDFFFLMKVLKIYSFKKNFFL